MKEKIYVIEPFNKDTSQDNESVPFPHKFFKINKRLPKIKGL
jgi:hypothetical protein